MCLKGTQIAYRCSADSIRFFFFYRYGCIKKKAVPLFQAHIQVKINKISELHIKVVTVQLFFPNHYSFWTLKWQKGFCWHAVAADINTDTLSSSGAYACPLHTCNIQQLYKYAGCIILGKAASSSTHSC